MIGSKMIQNVRRELLKMRKTVFLVVLILAMLSVNVCLANSKLVVGNTVTFGRYEQDNKDDGPEPLAWEVLDVRDGKALLISKYIIELKPYHSTAHEEGISWETCSLRKWLNEDFYNTAFNDRERKYILLTDVDNSTLPEEFDFPLAAGNDTQDYIFLLSLDDVINTYFSDNESRMRGLTKYTEAKDSSVLEDLKVGSRQAESWWLRSMGAEEFRCQAGYVWNFGKASLHEMQEEEGGVCPAFWLDLSIKIEADY